MIINSENFQISHFKIDQAIELIRINVDINDCLNNCSNNGLCKKINDKKFKCICNKDYAGTKCEYNTNPCWISPCLNNGTCYRNKKNFNCECSYPFYGTFCENKINICKGEECSRNGICIDDNSRPKCKCFSMFSGDKCEFKSEEKVTISKVQTTSSTIAIIIIVLIFIIFLLFDISNFCCKIDRRKINYNPKNLVFQLKFK
ncbi:unnamed protein product [Brachionus calyciflorus]|uniref:EGF-like domain-containing protein n=1 Tax=Brachionus calyciflorus TaxID=104777 RepID=A0A814S641_9BILA|nr:unnamed protein product [Brachionus calyciflorus]